MGGSIAGVLGGKQMKGEALLKVSYEAVDEFSAATMVGDKLTQALLGREVYEGIIFAKYHKEHGWRAIKMTIVPQSLATKAINNV